MHVLKCTVLSRGRLIAGSWRRKQCLKSSRSCHAPFSRMQHSAWRVLHRSVPLPCLYAGGVSVCTGLCQLTLICLISTSKSLTSPHANKHIQSSFKPKPLSNTCLISSGPERRFIMHLKKCPAPALQAESSLLPGFYVIALTFSGGRERLPPQQTEVCVSLWAVNAARYCRLGMYTVLIHCPRFSAIEIDSEHEAHPHLLQPWASELWIYVPEKLEG